MIKRNWRLRSQVRGVLTASAFTLGIYAHPTLAQAPPAAETANTADLETVVVTGSYIQGTPKDAALPVDVVTNEDLEKQGSPTMVQFVKTMTASEGTIGESNRYVAGAGTAQVNLRGFGADRSLVLMNSRRLSDNPLAAGQNLNFIPTAAIGRVEVLKGGAAATYGSDAIGGVVNFITRTDLNGLELSADYAYIQGSDGDYRADVAWGTKTGTGNVLLTFGYRHRSRLDIHERDWAVGHFRDPAYGGFTGAANPGQYVQNTTAGTAIFRDNGCVELGGVLTNGAAGQPVSPNNPVATTSTCRFQFSQFNDIVNKEDHFQVFGEFNGEVGDSITSHTEFAWSRDYVPEQRISPANTNTQFPTPISLGGTSGSTATPTGLNYAVRYNVPTYNPGLIDLRTQCAGQVTVGGGGLTPAQCAQMGAAGGVDISQTVFRAIAFAGHPTNADGADHQWIDSKSFRVSGGLKGEFHNINWDTALTFMQARGTFSTNDLLVDRIQLALNGFGSLNDGPACTSRALADAGNAAKGCYFFNPFTNSIAVSAVNHQNNPYYRGDVNPAVNNNAQVVQWLYGNYINELQNELTVFDGVLSGKLGLKLPGGEMAWALGVQYRHTRDRQDYGDLFNNKITPCVDSIDDGTPICGNKNGPFIFFGSAANTDASRNVYAGFGELSLPILESLEGSLAVRYESYPGNIGNTTDPKLSLRWQPLDFLVIRGSAGTTFRAPTAGVVNSNCATGVVNIAGTYRAQVTCGNPDLKPETAKSYDLGVIFTMGGFVGSLDYYYFDFTKELTVESSTRIYNAMFNVTPALTAGNDLNCGNPQFAALQSRFNFASGTCGRANVLGITRYNVNGPSTKTSGVDLRLEYDWKAILGGSLNLGLEATYLIDYRRGAFSLKGDPNTIIADPEDRAGKADLVGAFASYAQLKGNLYATYTWKDLSVRWQTRYISGTEALIGAPTSMWVQDPSGDYHQELIGKTDAFWQHDLIVRYALPWETTAIFSVQNVFDTDPPFAPAQYNYDYFSGNPLGQVFKIEVKKRF